MKRSNHDCKWYEQPTIDGPQLDKGIRFFVTIMVVAGMVMLATVIYLAAKV